MKKVIGLFLAALMLMAVLPGAILSAQAEGEETQTETPSETQTETETKPETQTETQTETKTETEGRKGTIYNCKKQVNVRAKATSNSKLLGKAKKGETFKVLGTSGNWVKIDYNGKEGFVYKTYIRVEGTPGDTPIEGDKTGKIYNCKTQVNVREQATSLSKLLGVAKKGETFKMLAKAENWVKIQYTSDTVGYVFHSYIKEVSGDEPQETPVTGDKVGKIYNCRTQVNVREKATSNSKLIGVAQKGTTYKVLGTSGSWVKIDYDGKEGFVYKSYIRVTEAEESIEGKTATIDCKTQVNVRAKATKDSKLLGKAKKGETFKITGKSGNWIKIDFNGKTGFVYKRYVKIG